jgi:hypothetical protein
MRLFLILDTKSSNVDIKKADLTEGLSFGSSAIFSVKTRRFLPPSHGGFSLSGQPLLRLYIN